LRLTTDLKILLADLNEDGVLVTVEQKLEAGENPFGIIEELRNGMTIVGDRFERQEYFLSELIMAAEIFRKAMGVIEPKLGGEGSEKLGTVAIGTVQGDIHSIGKDLVATSMKCAGYKVIDLGVDVSPERFVTAVKETGANVLGMSTLMTFGLEPMKLTVKSLIGAGLKGKVKVIIGGSPIFGDPKTWVNEVGADDWGGDAVDAVRKVKELISFDSGRRI